MLNISSKRSSDHLESHMLFNSGKSCYVIARFSLEVTFWEFYVPGFLLMNQCLENLIKSFLKQKNISWKNKKGTYGNKGHQFKRLLELGKSIDFFQNKILKRQDFLNLLKELEEGYNLQRYGQSGHFIKDNEAMMDLFDEIVYMFVAEYPGLIGQKDNEKLMAIPMPVCIEKTFKRKLKQPFIFSDVIPLGI